MENKGGEILIAEDDVALASVLRFNLERAGFRVTVARNGREAWEYLEEQPFDLVLTDEQMPEMSGRDLCGLLRGHAERAHTPVIMLTAKGLELDRKQLREQASVDTLFLKPFSPSEVIRAVQDCLAPAS